MSKSKGRPSKIGNCRLYTNGTVNPRRAGSHGHRTWEVVNATPGITTEDAVAAGARVKDINWDIERENIRAVPSEEVAAVVAEA